MKALFLLLLLPSAAFADTDVACRAGIVKFNFISGRGSINDPGVALTIVANGILHTIIDTRVDSVIPGDDSVIATVTTVNQDGEVDNDSGQAVIMLGVKEGGMSNGNGHIHMIKMPKSRPGLVIRPDYNLTGCTGSTK